MITFLTRPAGPEYDDVRVIGAKTLRDQLHLDLLNNPLGVDVSNKVGSSDGPAEGGGVNGSQ